MKKVKLIMKKEFTYIIINQNNKSFIVFIISFYVNYIYQIFRVKLALLLVNKAFSIIVLNILTLQIFFIR